jgi:hypothetical protein
VHRGFSFESALQDALMLFAEGKETIMVGGIEEHTPTYVELNRRANKFKLPENASVPIHQSTTKGIQMGEGATFFVLSKTQTEKSVACIYGLQTLYKPSSTEDLLKQVISFLASHQLTLSDIDVTLMGFSGDVNFDALLKGLLLQIESQTLVANYKQVSGEYHTASAFATWLASKLIEKQVLPKALSVSGKTTHTIKHVLIINQYLGINYSFMLLGKN